MTEVVFLELSDVEEIQTEQIQLYGGRSGIRDENLLESAVNMPQMGIGNQYLHASLFDKASAYAYHITQNHPFVDGNKRTGLAAALVFLKINDIEILDPKGKLEHAMIEIASDKLSKKAFAQLLEELAAE